nr:hypothetical protein [Tanacetum cinerariifolium]
MDNQVDDLTSHNTRYTSSTLTQKVFANMQRVGKCFLGVETPLFALVMVQPHQVEEEEEVAVPNTPTPPSPTISPSSPPQDPTPTSYATPHASPPQKQPSLAHDSTMSLLYPKRLLKEPKKKRVDEETLLQESFKKLKAVEVSGSESTQETPSNDLKEMSEEDVQNIMVRNVDSPSKFLMYPRFLQVVMDNQVDDMTSHNTRYTSLTLTQKVFANMRRVRKGFSGVESPVFPSMLILKLKKRVKKLEKKRRSKHSGFKRLRRVEQDKHTQALEIIKLKKRVKKLEKKRRSNSLGLKRLRKDSSAATKDVNAAEPTVFDDKEVTMTMAQTLIKMKVEKGKLLDEQMAQRLHDEENMAGYKMEHFRGMTYDKKSFKKLKAVEVSGSKSTHETPSNDPKEMSEEDIQNMLQIVSLSKFKVEALQVNSAVPSVDKEKALWVKLKRLFEPDVDDVLWKLQRERLALVKWSHDPDAECKTTS